MYLRDRYAWTIIHAAGPCHTEIGVADLFRQLYGLPHWDRSCWSNFLSHPVTVYWHQTNQSQSWPYKRQAPGRIATGVPVFKSLVWLDLEESLQRKWESNPRSAALKDVLTTRPTKPSPRVQNLRQCSVKAKNIRVPSLLFHQVVGKSSVYETEYMNPIVYFSSSHCLPLPLQPSPPPPIHGRQMQKYLTIRVNMDGGALLLLVLHKTSLVDVVCLKVGKAAVPKVCS